MVMVMALGPNEQPRYELRHEGCVDETDQIGGTAFPMQPNRYDYANRDEYERAVTAVFACTRCGGV